LVWNINGQRDIGIFLLYQTGIYNLGVEITREFMVTTAFGRRVIHRNIGYPKVIFLCPERRKSIILILCELTHGSQRYY